MFTIAEGFALLQFCSLLSECTFDLFTCQSGSVPVELGDPVALSAAGSEQELKLHPLSLAALHEGAKTGHLRLQETHLDTHTQISQ